MKLYRYAIIVDSNAIYNIIRIIEKEFDNVKNSFDGKYIETSEHLSFCKCDINNGVYANTFIDSEDNECKCFEILQLIDEKEVEELNYLYKIAWKNQVKEYYIKELEKVIDGCQRTIQKIKS